MLLGQGLKFWVEVFFTWCGRGGEGLRVNLDAGVYFFPTMFEVTFFSVYPEGV